jgi:hypothetical protein
VKPALKYGFLVALAIVAWVALKHFVLHLEPRTAQFADVATFNLAAIVGLALRMREKRVLTGGTQSFTDGWMTGIKIAVTYAILITAYFAVLIALVGRTLLRFVFILVDRQRFVNQTLLLLCMDGVTAGGWAG